MANFTVSPGVAISEIDNTFLTGQPVQAGAAIIGPTVKGPYEVPTLVTSYLQYTSLFGDSFVSGGVNYSYLTSIAAYNYFNYGGSSLLVARVASGSFTAATSSIIENNVTSVSGLVASSSFDVSTIITGSATASYAGIRIEIPGENDYYVAPNPFFTSFNNITDIYYSSSGATTNDNFDNYMAVVVSTINNSSTEFPTVGLTASYNAGSNIFTLSAINPGDELNGINIYKEAYTGQIGTLVGTLSGGTANIGSNSFTLETLSEGIVNNSTSPEISGVLSSGSKDNLRWEITNLNTGSGTFNVLIRQGNDTPNNKLILESFNNVSLDPNSNRFISLVIGDQKLDYNSTNNQMELTGNYKNISKYVRVKSITDLTPNYLDPNGTISDAAFSTYLPLNQTGSFGNATGTVAANVGTTMYENIGATTQGLVDTDYTNMVALLGNREAYQFNVLFTPGITNNQHPGVVSNIISNTQNRGDNFYVLDLIDYNGTVASIIVQANTRNTSYAASYWPWVRIIDPATGKQVWVPASTVIPGVYAFNDKVSAPWFAPAGINRGGLSTVLQAQFKLTQANKDALYSNNINPLATLPREGVVVFGQKTLQKEASALDRINVRRLLIEMKGFIRQIADTIVFEQNTITTRNSFIARVTPFLEGIQQKQGLYAFKVVMDDSNNGPDVIDRNQLIGQIYIQPTRTAEFISLDFILLPTGAEFPA
jgi:phage tail sheath protein FI